jgi:hypothetical protein
VACIPSLNLSWNAVQDASGIDFYEWQLEVSAQSSGSYTPLASGDVTGTSVTVQVDCKRAYRWRVRAVDNAGNVGAYSDFQNFSWAPSG